jgi:prolyl oligopeptidase
MHRIHWLYSPSAACAALACFAGLAFAQAPAPLAPRAADETFFGTTVADPYRFMENIKAPEVAAWMKAQNAIARATLARIGGRNAMLKSVQKYDNAAAARVYGVTRSPGDLWFYEKRGASENQFKLYVRQGESGAERLLVDPDAFARKAGGKPHAINWYSASPDGSHVAYGISAAGSEAASMRVVNVRSGKQVGGVVDRTDFGSPSWSLDGKAIYVNRLQPMKKGASPLEKYKNARVERIPLGGSAAAAKVVFGNGTPGVKSEPAESPFLGFTEDGRHALGLVVNGVQRELRLYSASAASVLAGKAEWKLVFDTDAAIVNFAYADGLLYAITHKDAPRYKLIAAPLDGFDAATGELVVAPSERVVTGLAAASDALYIEMRDGNIKRLVKREHKRGAPLVPVALPVEGSFQLGSDEGGTGAADPRLPGVVIELQSWTRARQIYRVAADGSVSNTGLQPAGPFDMPAGVVATELQCKAADGALVPMSVMHQKDAKLDGSNPTILYGYGSYGMTEEPFFSPHRQAWLDAGGVFAVANPRGSGVYGNDWYKAGYQDSKPNTWRDFIACAETLVAQKYTQPARLGIWGGSAGGITVGRAFTERPDLFAAAVPAVGALDLVRAEVTPNGVPNIPEFGTRTTEAGFNALLAMSTYHQIKDGVKYPAVMFTHGVNDPRVEVWHSTKTAARLMAASTSGKPVLLRLDYEAGHGIGNTKAQAQAERADVYSFMLWQMGMPGYELKPEIK